MRVNPKTEKEALEANLWPAGEYSFQITSAEERLSKKGNEMIELKLNVFNDEGHSRIMFDYLMDTDMMAFKLRHCAIVCGVIEQYEQGTLLDRDFTDKVGSLKLTIQKGKNGDPDRNGIADYIVGKDREGQVNSIIGAANSKPDDFIDDEIPFD